MQLQLNIVYTDETLLFSINMMDGLVKASFVLCFAAAYPKCPFWRIG